MQAKILGAFSTLAFIGLITACTMNGMPTASQGEAIFVDYCAACHDYSASGGHLVGGQAAPDLTSLAAQNDGVFPRAYVLSTIDGYDKDGASDHIMPEFGGVMGTETVPVDIDGVMTPTPRPLAALLVYLESVQVPAS